MFFINYLIVVFTESINLCNPITSLHLKSINNLFATQYNTPNVNTIPITKKKMAFNIYPQCKSNSICVIIYLLPIALFINYLIGVFTDSTNLCNSLTNGPAIENNLLLFLELSFLIFLIKP